MGKLLGGHIGASESTGGAGGKFDLNDHYWVNQRHQMVADPGLAPAMTATGGSTATYSDTNGDWKSHKFTASGTFAVSDYAGEGIEYLIVGGGGGGGASGTGGFHAAGGGGGGGI